jgi:transmembrane sensor
VNKKEFSNLIDKYNRGECSPKEKELLENFLESFQNNPGEWIETEMGDQKTAEGKIYSEIIKNIDKEKNQNNRLIFFSPVLLKRAASIIFIIIAGLGILYISGIFQQKTDSIVWHEKITSPGEKSLITLSDGSKINLNADSKLKYPGQFDGTIRDVYLEGEGYFEVYHNRNKPFIVHAENLTTTVLGTKFDISAYPDAKTISVSLLEGKVKVAGSEKGKNKEVIFLQPKEKLLYNKENNISSFGAFDSVDAVGWKDNVYKFENEPLNNVLSRLERAFGVKFRLTDKSVLAQKITIKFEKNSLQTVIDVIKNLTGLDYKIVKDNNTIKEILFFRDNK